MKRLLFVLFLVFAIARISSAQTIPHVSVEFTQTAIYKIVDGLAAGQGYRIEGKLPADLIDIKLTDQPLDTVLAQTLEPHGYGFNIDVTSKTIKIYESSGPATKNQPINSSPLGNRRAIVDQILSRYPQAYNANGVAREIMANADSMAEANAALGEFSRTTYYNGFLTNSPYGYSGAYGAPWLVGCSDGRPSSYLEFKYKGARDQRELWFISINGITPGSVDQGDSFWNKIPICSDAAVVVSVEKIGESRTWERQYSLRPFTSTEVSIGEFLFKDTKHLK